MPEAKFPKLTIIFGQVFTSILVVPVIFKTDWLLMERGYLQLVILVLSRVKVPPVNIIPLLVLPILLMRLLLEKLAVPPVIAILRLEVEKVELFKLAVAPAVRDKGEPANLVTVDPVRLSV